MYTVQYSYSTVLGVQSSVAIDHTRLFNHSLSSNGKKKIRFRIRKNGHIGTFSVRRTNRYVCLPAKLLAGDRRKLRDRQAERCSKAQTINQSPINTESLRYSTVAQSTKQHGLERRLSESLNEGNDIQDIIS